MSKTNGNGHNPEDKAKEEKERERADKERRRLMEKMSPEFFALFGKEGDELIEVGIITEKENILNSIVIMQEEIQNPNRKKRLSRVVREAKLRGSIAVGGQGRKDIHLIGERKVQEQTASNRGAALDM